MLLNGDQVQPNGVDLKVDNIYKIEGKPTLMDLNAVPSTRRIEVAESGFGNAFYRLDRGAYIVEYAEKIKIPTNHSGYVVPRSSLMRCGIMLFSAWWDSGYEGRGEGLMVVFSAGANIEEFMRVGQIILMKNRETSDTYDGQYQGERLEDDDE